MQLPLASAAIVPLVVYLEVSVLINEPEPADLICELEYADLPNRFLVVLNLDDRYWVVIIL